MHKLTTTTTTGHGTALLRKLATSGSINKASAAATPQRVRTGLFSPMFDHTKANLLKAATATQVSTAGKKPTPLVVAAPTMKAPGESISVELDTDDPRAVHAHMLRESAAAHERLLASIKAVHAGPTVSPSKGPEAL